jgi:mono/diheme cytochrome c family protein
MKHALIALSALALAAALTVPAVTRADEPPVVAQSGTHASLTGPSRFEQKTGKEIYDAVCASCHMPNGMGGTGAGFYPALANNPKLESWAYPAMMVIKGNGAMPSFADHMTDAQIAAVVTYVRTHFGNAFNDPIPAAELKALRAP